MTSFSPTQPFVGTQRNELRKLARNHPDFDRWRAINDPKNEMKKGEIIKAINDLGLVAQADAILGAPQTAIVGVIGEDGVYDIEGDDETGAGDGGVPPSLAEGQGAGLNEDRAAKRSVERRRSASCEAHRRFDDGQGVPGWRGEGQAKCRPLE